MSLNTGNTGNIKRCAIALTGFALFSSAHMANAADNHSPAELASMLSKGGYVVYIRHTTTEKDYADQVNAEIGNCSTQRTLSEKGWDEAELIGASFDILNIPVGALYSSEYCRAWKTARIAFGKPIKRPGLNFEPAEEYTDAQTAKMSAAVVPMISEPPSNASNTIIVGHDDPFEAATGIYPEPQGVTFVVHPKGDGKFEVMGSIKPDEWAAILSKTN